MISYEVCIGLIILAVIVCVGSLNLNDAISYGISGPIVRSVGIRIDIRFYRSETYASY